MLIKLLCSPAQLYKVKFGQRGSGSRHKQSRCYETRSLFVDHVMIMFSDLSVADPSSWLGAGLSSQFVK